LPGLLALGGVTIALTINERDGIVRGGGEDETTMPAGWALTISPAQR
jgi:hypothetical protein